MLVYRWSVLLFLLEQACRLDAFPLNPCKASRQSPRCAKPPPVSNFDLDAIEAFESKLDLYDLQEAEGFEALELLEEGAGSDSVDEIKEFVVPESLHNKRIDAVIAALEPTLSRSVCGNLVVDGMVHDANGNKLDKKATKLSAGAILQVQMPADEKPVEIIPQNLPLRILYEDDHMIVLNKAAGMVVHPAAGNWDGTVVNALAHYLATESPFGSGDFVGSESVLPKAENTNDPTGADGEVVSFRPGIVHRLDKGTTGVLVVAKTTRSLSALSAAFASRSVKKTYLAITVGNPGKQVTIDKPIGRHPIHRQKMRVVPDPHRSSSLSSQQRLAIATASSKGGRRALSHVDTLAFDGKLSIVQVRIETGRTHQIRVHLQGRHTPIYGDDIYGIADWNKRLLKSHGIERPLLHAYRLEIDHPITDERMVFCAPLPEDMKVISKTVWPDGEQERPDIYGS